MVDEPSRLRVERVLDLVVAQLGLPKGQVADMLLARPAQRRYLLVRPLGQTRHSTVYAAVDRLLARTVAIKMHHDERAEDEARSVLIEARTMSLLEHVNVVRVHDVGEHEGTMYSVTELCDEDMRTWCDDKRWDEIVERIIEAGRGLRELHAAGFVHGDVKPANILVKRGVAKVADFGMSARPGLSLRVAGTPGFIAPEVTEGMRGPTNDVFGLACSAWICLFGSPPFPSPPEGADLSAAVMFLIEQAREGAIRAPAASTRVPARVESVIRSGLEPDPAKRPSLQRWLGALAACRPRQRHWRARPEWLLSVALFACVLVAAGASGHAFYAACAVEDIVEPELPPEPEPDAIDLAKNDDPLGAWTAYYNSAQERPTDPDERLELSMILLLDAESGAAKSPVVSAEVAKRVANDMIPVAIATVSYAQVSQAKEIMARCDLILSRSSRPSRPD